MADREEDGMTVLDQRLALNRSFYETPDHKEPGPYYSIKDGKLRRDHRYYTGSNVLLCPEYDGISMTESV